MAVTAKARKIDQLMEEAMQALSRRAYFDAERTAHQALCLAREATDYQRIMRIMPALQEARRQRMQLAVDAQSTVHVLDTAVPESMRVEPGCYLVQPPLVGADARRLRLLALEQNVPVMVICREPTTRMRLCPIVAITPGFTVRAKIDPPADPAQPTIEWILDAMEALGDWAITTLDSELTPPRRVEAILTRLEAVPEHELLHQLAVDAAEEAFTFAQEEERNKPVRRGRPSPASSEEETAESSSS
jgi:hypothetical protein